MRNRTFFVTALVLALLIAGGASYYASAHPDGLEHVAEKAGFLDAAEDSPVADGPLADYQATGIEDARLSGGVAGVLGVLLVLVLAGGLAWLVRRRGDRSDPDEPAVERPAPRPSRHPEDVP